MAMTSICFRDERQAIKAIAGLFENLVDEIHASRSFNNELSDIEVLVIEDH